MGSFMIDCYHRSKAVCTAKSGVHGFDRRHYTRKVCLCSTVSPTVCLFQLIGALDAASVPKTG